MTEDRIQKVLRVLDVALHLEYVPKGMAEFLVDRVIARNVDQFQSCDFFESDVLEVFRETFPNWNSNSNAENRKDFNKARRKA